MVKTERVKPGDVFGRLTVLDRDVAREQEREALGRHPRPYFKCRCECGNEISGDMYRLLRGSLWSCGCGRQTRNAGSTVDLTGKTFGKLTVIERDYEYEGVIAQSTGKKAKAYYKCRCSCGNVKTICGSQLTTNLTRSCGCLRRESISEQGKRRVIDLTGRTFGNITVIRRDAEAPTGCGKHAYWIGVCSLCGNTKSFRGSDLTSGRVTDCGCTLSHRLSVAAAKNLIGMKFGHLEVIERDMTNGTQSGQHARWWCKCDLCGSAESVSSDSLTKYGKDRCLKCSGHTSIGEQKIMEILDEHGVTYEHDKRFRDCIYPESGGVLYFDFIVGGPDNVHIIEFDGVQHFKEIPYWERSIDLNGRKGRDTFKNEWCAKNGIPIIRIPYTHLKDICYEDLMPNTSAFLVS